MTNYGRPYGKEVVERESKIGRPLIKMIQNEKRQNNFRIQSGIYYLSLLRRFVKKTKLFVY